jgi:sulfate permease, SulP family
VKAPSAISPARYLSDLFAGTLAALVMLTYAVSYGAMIFGGRLDGALPRGMPAALVTCSVAAFVVALRSSLSFTIAGPDSNATAALAALCAALAAAAPATAGGEATVVPTVLAALAVTSLVTGACLYLLGRKGWGRLVQLIPHAVVGGFLAGTGYLVVGGAFRTVTGHALDGAALGALRAARREGVVTALAVAATLLVLSRRTKHFLLVPGVILAGIGAFYLAARFEGAGLAALRARGLLLQPVSLSSLTVPAMLPLHQVRWTLIAARAVDVVGVVTITLLSILLNSAGLELAAQREVDFDRELRAAGIANLVCGLCGGIIGCQSISRSLISRQAGAKTRVAAVWASAASLLVVALAPGVVSLLPKPVMAGLLLYLGVAMLIEWTIVAYGRLPRHEYAVVITMLAAIGRYGMVAGVFLGLLASCILFAFKYGQVSCVRFVFTSATHRSRVERSLRQQRVLAERGEQTLGLCLQGYLFFGSAAAITDRVAAMGSGVRQLVLDFHLVTGMDTAAVLAFTKIEQLCAARGVALAMSGLGRQRALFERGGLLAREVFERADLDGALEWAEARLLEEVPAAAAGGTLRTLLAPHFRPENLERLLFLLEPIELGEGETVFATADRTEPLVFVERGRIALSLPADGGASVRVGSYGPGTLLSGSELFARGAKSGEVRAEEPGRAFRLTRDKMRELERTSPAAAVELKNLVIETLAARLAVASHDMKSLLSAGVADDGR